MAIYDNYKLNYDINGVVGGAKEDAYLVAASGSFTRIINSLIPPKYPVLELRDPNLGL